MPGLTCNACNKEFKDDSEQKLHYKSEWHRYNLKRKVAGVPGVTEALFLARQTAIDEEKNKLTQAPMLYSCGVCGKEYRSAKAHGQHLQSRSHLFKASQGTGEQLEENTVMKPLPQRLPNRKPPTQADVLDEDSEESEDEWEEVDPEEEELMNVDGHPNDSMDEDEEKFGDVDPSCCFMCDKDHDTIESCMVHMHKEHGFFIPDVEYLKDPKGFLTYLGIKVKRDFICLYCNDRCHPFSSLEAVRKHMVSKSHCKVHYGDGDEDEEAELEEFYDYSSSYVDVDGKQLVLSDGLNNDVELGPGGSELIITRRTSDKISVRTLGSREYLRYYRQKPRPLMSNNSAITSALASRYSSMGLATVQSRVQMVRMKVLKEMNRSGVEAMRSKIGMKSNVIRNLPNNVTH